jgi:small-conductance mechanosensitive channel
MKTFSAFALIVLAIFVLSAPVQAQSRLPGVSGSDPATAGAADTQSVLDQMSAGGLSEADLNALVVQLSDEQIRQVFLTVLRERLGEPTVEPESTPLFARVDSKLRRLRQNLGTAISALPRVVEVPAFLFDSFNLARGPFHIVLVIVAVLAIYLIAYVAERLVGTLMQKWMAKPPSDAARSRMNKVVSECNNFLTGIVRLLVFSVVAFAVFFVFWQSHQPTRLFVVSVTVAVIAVRLTLFLAAFAILPGPNGEALFAFEPEAARKIKRQLDQVVYMLAFLGVLGFFLAEFGFDPNGAVALNLTLGTLVLIILVRLVLTAHRPVAALIRGPGEEPGLLTRGLASSWHLAALAYLGFIYIAAVLARTAGAGREDGTFVGPGTISIAIVLAVPFLSAVAKAFADAWKEAKREEDDPESRAHLKPSFVDVVYRVVRLGLVICAIMLIARTWGLDFFGATERAVGEDFSKAIFNIAITAILAYAVWLVVEVSVGASVHEQEDVHVDAGGEGGGTGASRLETLLPLLRRFFQITIVVIAGMIILSSIGVDIGPLIAGAGVVGLAIGFGAQKLVTDVISGLFYLIDDAFRAGEYVDIGDVKGRVESTNVRSLVLRHHRGPLHTVPYSEIKHLTNYSRDWVIMKLEFRVTYDTDVNKVKKIFRTIGEEMLADPVIGEDFLQPFKSQGVKSMEESAMIVRGKFMAKPGKQFLIRKEIYSRVQKAFEENDIHFAHRRVAVDLPPGFESHPQAEAIAEAAAAAAAAQDDEQPKEAVQR